MVAQCRIQAGVRQCQFTVCREVGKFFQSYRSRLAPRCIHNAEKNLIIMRVDEQAQIGEKILDFTIFEI